MEQREERLAIWIIFLRVFAGYLNAMAIIEFGRVVSAYTGNSTKFAIALVQGDLKNLLPIIMVMSFFVLGAMTSGFFSATEELKMRVDYGFLFIAIGIGHLLFGYFEPDSFYYLIYLSFALGIQNGITINYKGIKVRTTILSGTVTDIGVEIGCLLRGATESLWKLKFYIHNLLFFMFGAVLATLISLHTTIDLMLGAGVLALLIGFYFAYTQKEILEIDEEGLL